MLLHRMVPGLSPALPAWERRPGHRAVGGPARSAIWAEWLSRLLPGKARTWVESLGLGDLLHRSVWAISVEDEEVRAVLLQGREVVTWGMVRIENAAGLTDGVAGAEGGADQTRGLLQALRVHPGRLLVDLPLFAPLMRQMELPSIKRRYLAQVVLSELQGAVPFTLGEVDVAWQVRRTETGNRVFSIATPREVMDARVGLLKRAGTRPSSAYAKATALAMAAGVPNVVAVHLEPMQVAVVLVQDGTPSIVHRVALGQIGEGPQEQAEAVLRAVDQVAGYFEPLASVQDDAPLPVMLTGRLSTQGPLVAALRRQLRRPVVPIAVPFNCPEHFPVAEYAINLGLVLAEHARGKMGSEARSGKALVVDLLPERHIYHPVPARPVASFAALLALGIAAFSATGQVEAKADEAARLSVQADRWERLDREHRLDQMRAAGALKKLESATVTVGALEFHLEGLATEMITLIARLDAVSDRAAPVAVSHAVLEGESYALSGTASSYDDVLRYTDALRASGLFNGVRIMRMEGGEVTADGDFGIVSGQPSISFQIKAAVPPFRSDEEAKTPTRLQDSIQEALRQIPQDLP